MKTCSIKRYIEGFADLVVSGEDRAEEMGDFEMLVV
jgi:hypothetical protein